MKMSSKMYDVLQKVMRIFTPLSIFLASFGEIWGISEPMIPVIKTLSALALLLGAVLEISSAQYKKDKEAEEHKEE